MNAFVILACILGAVSAQLHTQCHSNVQQLREEEVVALVADIADRNADNFISMAEFAAAFLEIFPYTQPTILPIAGLAIQREDFVNKWHARFGDSLEFARASFNAFDTNKDGRLTVYEIEAIYNQVLGREDNGDGRVSAAEFRRYLLWVYGEAC